VNAEVIGHVPMPQKRIGKHFDLINANKTSSEALRPIFPKNIVEGLIKASFVLGKRAFELNRAF